jgi:integrase
MRNSPDKRTLTDTFVRGLKAAPADKRDHYWDAKVPGFGVRVTEHGTKSFILYARVPPSRSPARLHLGDAGKMGLAAAREKAKVWSDLIEQGKDPRDIERQKLLEEQRKVQTTFAAVAEDFIREKLPAERKGKEVQRDIRRDLIPAWGRRPITDITRGDVIAVIRAKKGRAPAQARNLLGIMKRFFAWAKDQDSYGVAMSPCADLRAKPIFGSKLTGDRVLSDEELFAVWRATKRMPYPHGSVYQLLILTALRLNEVADAKWPEFDMRNRLWTIPAARMKGTNDKAHPHAVPLSDEVCAILATLPRFKKGSFLFSTTFGDSPVWMNTKVKRRLDHRMLRTLRALARRRGDDPSKVTLRHWTNHDIRRTVRSNLSRLKIAEEVREAVLAHARPGIKGTYDLYDYFDEKREALDLWAARLRSIVSPPPGNVVSTHKKGVRR